MKAPDKIYLSRFFIFGVGETLTERVSPNDAEYIRKDFLLEWLDKMKEDLIKDSDFRDTEVGRYDSIVTIRYKIEQL